MPNTIVVEGFLRRHRTGLGAGFALAAVALVFANAGHGMYDPGDEQESRELLAKFLDKSNSNQARAQAVQGIRSLDDEGARKLLGFAASSEQADGLRALALMKASEVQPQAAFELSLSLLKKKELANSLPKLRTAAAKCVRLQLEFGSSRDAEAQYPAIEALRGVLTKDEPESVRLAAMSYLNSTGDPIAEDLLRKSIRNPAEGVIDQSRAVGYAAAHSRKFEKELAAVLDQKAEPDAVAKAVEALASFPKYQQKIRAAMKDQAAPFEVRRAAVHSLPRYLPAAVKDALEMAEDHSESERMQVDSLRAISGAAMRFRALPDKWSESVGLKKEDFDARIRDLSVSDEHSKSVKDAASAYLRNQ